MTKSESSLDDAIKAAIARLLNVNAARVGRCLVAPLCGISLMLGCSKEEAPVKAGRADETAVTVVLKPVRVEAVQRSVEVVGTLWGDEDTTISNKVPGKVIAIYHDVGDRVKPGEPLAQLLRQDYVLAVNQRERALQEVLVKLSATQIPDDHFDVSKLPAVRKGEWVEVIQGLGGAERVAVKGTSKLATGVPVVIEEIIAIAPTTRQIAEKK